MSTAPASTRRPARRTARLAAGAATALLLSLTCGPARAGTTEDGGSAGGTAPRAVAEVPPPAAPTRTTSVTVAGVAGQVTMITDLRYATASPSQVLDLYVPPRGGRRLPLVVWIHGGGFSEGDKSSEQAIGEAVLRSKYAVASINYRMTGERGYPAAVQDVKAAVRWLRAHATTYGLRADRIAVWGESAGGYLATMVGVTGSQKTGFDAPALGYASTSSAVQAVVDEYGPMDFLTADAQAVKPGGCPGDWWARYEEPDSVIAQWLGAPVRSAPATVRAASPLTYLAKARTLPPFAVIHGDKDCTVPYGQSLQLVNALKARKATVWWRLVPGAEHSDPLLLDDGPILTATIAWLHAVLDRP